MEAAVEELWFGDTVSNYIITEADGVELLKNKFSVAKKDAFIELKTDNIDNVERSFGFDNLWYEGGKNASVEITDGIISKKFEIKSDSDPQYVNIHKFLCNLGYSESHGNSYKIIFSNPGVYTFDSIKIYNQSLEGIKDWVAERKEARVEYSFGEDSIHIKADTDKDGILYVSVPYSTGWEASVNGEKTDVLKVNGFGMGICVGEGEHEVEFRYHTPYMRLGTVLMFIGIIACSAILVYDKNIVKKAHEQINGKGR